MSPEGRLSLLQELRRRGFYVRMHAYEYLVADRTGFLAILLLEPSAGSATVVDLRGSKGEISAIVDSVLAVDPQISIRMRRPGGHLTAIDRRRVDATALRAGRQPSTVPNCGKRGGLWGGPKIGKNPGYPSRGVTLSRRPPT